MQNPDVVRLGAEQIHKVIVAHRLLLRLGGRRVQALLVELQHTGAGRVVEQTARGGQQTGVRDGRAPFAAAAGRRLVHLLRQQFPFALVVVMVAAETDRQRFATIGGRRR